MTADPGRTETLVSKLYPNIWEDFPPEAWESFKPRILDRQEQIQLQLLGSISGKNLVALLRGSATKHLNGVYEQVFFSGGMNLEILHSGTVNTALASFSDMKLDSQKAKEWGRVSHQRDSINSGHAV